MTSRTIAYRILGVCAAGAAMLLSACSSGKPYSLIASLPSTDHVVVGTIDVSNGQCAVHFASLDWGDFYTPPCKVVKDQSGFKSFNIAGAEVQFGAVDSGFKLLNTPPKLPGANVSATPATGTAAKPAAATTAAPAAGTAVAAAAPTGEDFPAQWLVQPYPGTIKLVGQNPGFPLNSAKLNIIGGDAMFDADFKVPVFKPLHVRAIVVANEHGDFRLVFNPHLTASQTSGGNYDITLVSEGTGISGNIWDSHGFDSWSPAQPPTWTASIDNN